MNEKTEDVQEFEDTDTNTAEGDFVEEDWESYDDSYPDEDEATEAPPKKNNSAFNKIVMAGAVVVALAVGGMKIFGGGASNPNPAAPGVSPAMTTAAVSEPGQRPEFHEETKVAPTDTLGIAYGDNTPLPPEPEPAPPPSGGMLHSGEAVGALQEAAPVAQPEPVVYSDAQQQPPVPVEGGQLPMPAPISQEPPAAAEPLMPMPGADVVSPVGSASLPGAQDVMLDSPAVPSLPSDPAAEAVDVVGVSSPAMEQQTATQSVATEKLDEITQRLTAMEQKLEGVAAIEQAIAGFESRIEKLEMQPARAVRSEPIPARAPLLDPDEPVAGERPAARRAEKPAQPAAEMPRWVLRSAQSGQALLARVGSDDTVSVRAGETVAGLGRITSIENEEGRWVVRGTLGQVSR